MCLSCYVVAACERSRDTAAIVRRSCRDFSPSYASVQQLGSGVPQQTPEMENKLHSCIKGSRDVLQLSRIAANSL